MNGFEMILPFLKPIEHLILDDSISEVMVNGPDQVFIEKDGFLRQVKGVSLGEKSLMVAVKNIARRLGDDISESKPILDSRLPGLEPDKIRLCHLNLSRILDEKDSFIFRDELPENVQECGLPAPCSAADEDVLAGQDIILKTVGKRAVERPCVD